MMAIIEKMSSVHSSEIRPVPPFNFELTVRKPAGWPRFTRDEVWNERVLWTALQIEVELVGVKLHSTGTTIQMRHIQHWLILQPFLAEASSR